MSEITLSLIAAYDKNRVIGSKGALPWPMVKTDMDRFKKLTTGHPVIMGRSTYESLPDSFRPLPGRLNIVLSRGEYKGDGKCVVVSTVLDALKAVGESEGFEETFVIGGEQMYKLFLPYARKVYATELDASYKGDAFFPELPKAEWKEIGVPEKFEAGPKNAHAGVFRVFETTRPWKRVVAPEMGRNETYRADLRAINVMGACPFCPGGKTLAVQEMIAENESWYVTFNYSPHENSKYHFLFISKQHYVSHSDMNGDEFKRLSDLLEVLKKKYEFSTGFLYGREGPEPESVGATVYHLHFHYIVPEAGKAVKIFFGPITH